MSYDLINEITRNYVLNTKSEITINGVKATTQLTYMMLLSDKHKAIIPIIREYIYNNPFCVMDEDKFSWTPLQLALRFYNKIDKRVIDILIDAQTKESINKVNKNNHTCLTYSLENGCVLLMDVFQRLFDKGADPNIRTNNNSLIKVILSSGKDMEYKYKLVKIFLDNGATLTKDEKIENLTDINRIIKLVNDHQKPTLVRFFDKCVVCLTKDACIMNQCGHVLTCDDCKDILKDCYDCNVPFNKYFILQEKRKVSHGHESLL